LTASAVWARALPWRMMDTGTSAVLTRYESLRVWSLHQNERTTTRDTLQQREGILHAVGRSLLTSTEADALMVYDALRKFGRRWYPRGEIKLKECKCVYPR
jgi:hypothetical protein